MNDITKVKKQVLVNIHILHLMVKDMQPKTLSETMIQGKHYIEWAVELDILLYFAFLSFVYMIK